MVCSQKQIVSRYDPLLLRSANMITGTTIAAILSIAAAMDTMTPQRVIDIVMRTHVLMLRTRLV